MKPNGIHTDETDHIAVAFHTERQRWYLYVWVGINPSGFPTETFREATAVEVKLWKQGRVRKLRQRLEDEGVPLPVAKPVGLLEQLRRFVARN